MAASDFFTDRLSALKAAQKSLDNAVSQMPPVQALKEQGFLIDDSYRWPNHIGMWAKPSTTGTELGRAWDQLTLSEYYDIVRDPDQASAVGLDFGAVAITVDKSGTPIKYKYGIGNKLSLKGGVPDRVIESMAAFFGYVVDTTQNPDFWANAWATIFDPVETICIGHPSGQFYFDRETLARAYEVFANLPSGADDGRWKDSNGDVIPLTFAKSIYTYTTDQNLLSPGQIKREVYFTCADPDVLLALARVHHSYGTRIEVLAYRLASAGAGTTNIDIEVVITYDDYHTYSQTWHMAGIFNSDSRNITLGGTTYYYGLWTNFGNFEPGMWVTLPNTLGLTELEDPGEMPPRGLVGVVQVDPGGVSVTSIPGTAHPTSGGNIPTTYPDWDADGFISNVQDDGEPDPTSTRKFLPFTFIPSAQLPSLTASDVHDLQTGPTSLPSIALKLPYIDLDWLKDIFEKNDKEEKEKSKDDGKNPKVTKDSDAGATPSISGAIPTDSGANSGFMMLYHPTKAVLQAFNTWMWTVLNLATFQKLFQDPISCIISLHEIFVKPTDATVGPGDPQPTIVLGYVDTSVNCAYVDSTTYTLDCGSVDIPNYFNNALDYEPYTTFQIFLPFIGFKDLQASDIVGRRVSVKYNIDLITGACVADITVSSGDYSCCMYSFAGNCAVQIPVSGSNFGQIISNIFSTAISGGMLAATGGATLPGFAGSVANLLTNSQIQISRSGNLGGNAGALTYKKPFIIATRPTSVVPYEYEEFTGYPASTQVKLGNCFGYTRVKAVHLDEVEATQREKEELEQLLKTGVIF